MNKYLRKSALLGIALVSLLASACSNNGKNSTSDSTTVKSSAADSSVKTGLPDSVKPSGQAPEWGKDIRPQMAAVIEQLGSYSDKPIPQLPPVEARKNHTPTDAVMDIMKKYNIPMPPTTVDTIGKEIPVAGGTIHLKIYTPKSTGPYPVIVYYHGGGFVIANINVYNASSQMLAEKMGAVVISVGYRLAPENKFPTAHNDAFAAYQWAVNNASSLHGDARKIALVGESAGGNLAVNTAIMARDKKIQLPVGIVAVYPIAGADMNTESYQKYANAKPLDKPMMMWFSKTYLNNMAEAKDPRINLVAANLKGLPPTTIINAELDPLQTDGANLADKLKAAGVSTDHKVFDGVTHEFFGMGALVPEALEAEKFAISQLQKAFKGK
ncbi:alpha/beta hydrolase [Mucilaginibacter ginkgonis]|uniref:Alpha/beta hydrolase n=1 Tax=Mucilaginibacter ginkgonis TaxID=2682091 RepID=A0A6I4HZ91_9SPHI|nr:alpha/beta hydrolase [Mucilaginibacter ginkgonis]QQL50219.1 alpha/beta hydrolase [Mucilaginibacter ginkgonis]